MRFSTVAAVVAAAGIAQVAATPIRIIVSTERINVGGNNTPEHHVSGFMMPMHHPVHPPKAGMRHACPGRGMNRFKQKGIEISNAFRKALGWPLIAEVHYGHNNMMPPLQFKQGELPEGMVQILPFVGSPLPNLPQPYGTQDAPIAHFAPHHHHHNHPHPHHGQHRFHHGLPPFVVRLHQSLMNLGRWEGRAVAFVLGCGIGVLLRMFWVLAVVFYRSVKGSRAEEHEYAHIIIETDDHDADAVVHSAPPIYTYPVDEKIAIEADAPKAATESK